MLQRQSKSAIALQNITILNTDDVGLLCQQVTQTKHIYCIELLL